MPNGSIDVMDVVSLIYKYDVPENEVDSAVNLIMSGEWTEEDLAQYNVAGEGAVEYTPPPSDAGPSNPVDSNTWGGRYEYTDEDFSNTQFQYDFDWATNDLESFLKYSYGINDPDDLITSGWFTAYDNTAEIFASDAFDRGSESAQDSMDATFKSKGMDAQRTISDLFAKDSLERFRGGSIALGSGITGELDDYNDIIDAYRESQNAAFTTYENKMNDQYGIYDKAIYNSRIDWLAGIASQFAGLDPTKGLWSLDNVKAASPELLQEAIIESYGLGYENSSELSTDWSDSIMSGEWTSMFDDMGSQYSGPIAYEYAGEKWVQIEGIAPWTSYNHQGTHYEVKNIVYNENLYLWNQIGRPEIGEVVEMDLGGTTFKVIPTVRHYDPSNMDEGESNYYFGELTWRIVGTAD
jgi:hypothetical protein